ncbi:Uncharacterised protein [Mycobacteroides abscessus subsp. abscessus]|nr:Uncharacterised protein [Mycobacteroides abscessus subsp. abscessus]SIN12075.1 Uncharacterised protein [Mycobacteroides abscessus subsp. abscessus]
MQPNSRANGYVGAAPRPLAVESAFCVHPRCEASPQEMYTFPIPLCRRHLVQVLARAAEVTRESHRDYLIKNAGKKPPVPMIDAKRQIHDSVVYYLRFGDRIKIGTTRHLWKRLEQLPHDKLLAVEPGDTRLERRRHLEFASDHIKGEWFAESKRLLAHIDNINRRNTPNDKSA